MWKLLNNSRDIVIKAFTKLFVFSRVILVQLNWKKDLTKTIIINSLMDWDFIFFILILFLTKSNIVIWHAYNYFPIWKIKKFGKNTLLPLFQYNIINELLSLFFFLGPKWIIPLKFKKQKYLCFIDFFNYL